MPNYGSKYHWAIPKEFCWYDTTWVISGWRLCITFNSSEKLPWECEPWWKLLMPLILYMQERSNWHIRIHAISARATFLTLCFIRLTPLILSVQTPNVYTSFGKYYYIYEISSINSHLPLGYSHLVLTNYWSDIAWYTFYLDWLIDIMYHISHSSWFYKCLYMRSHVAMTWNFRCNGASHN